MDRRRENQITMSFSPANEQWIRGEIQSAISSAVKGLSPPSGFRKALYLLREWGVLGTVAMAIVALATFAAAGWNSSNSRLEKESEFRAKTADALTRINERLQQIEGDLLRRDLRITSTLSQQQFNDNLDLVATTMELAKSKRVVIDNSLIRTVKSRLAAASPAVPQFWPAVANVVNYQGAEWVPHINLQALLPCVNWLGGSVSDLTFDENHGCVMDLDGADMARVTIKNGVVLYRGGPTKLKDVSFTNCYFVIVIPLRPDQSGEHDVASSLLSQDSNRIELRLVKSAPS